MFVFFTIYGILHLVFSNSSLINYEKYEKELINIKEFNSYCTKNKKIKSILPYNSKIRK
jgi:hypothetical protein